MAVIVDTYPFVKLPTETLHWENRPHSFAFDTGPELSSYNEFTTSFNTSSTHTLRLQRKIRRPLTSLPKQDITVPNGDSRLDDEDMDSRRASSNTFRLAMLLVPRKCKGERQAVLVVTSPTDNEMWRERDCRL